MARIDRAQKSVGLPNVETPAGHGGQLVLENGAGACRDQKFQHVGPGETEIPTYLQSQPSALLAQVADDRFLSHAIVPYNLSK